jgi:hypothetical protein
MAQQGQVLELSRRGADDRTVWAYRYRMGGRGSRRVQRGGFASEQAAAQALERALEQLRREQGLVDRRGSGSRSSTGTSTARPRSCTSAAPSERPHQDAEDEGERARRSPAGDRTRCPR